MKEVLDNDVGRLERGDLEPYVKKITVRRRFDGKKITIVHGVI